MQRPGGTGSIDRGARVRLIKKVIIGLLAAVILLPTLLCVVLFFKLNKIEQECRDLSERMLVMEKSSDDMYTAVSMERKNAEDAVSFNEIENKESDTPEDVQALPDAAQISKEESVSEDETAHTDWPKKVYLTFDDGPSSNTAAILDILNSYGVKGNFFVVATDKEELRAMYKRIVDEGHVIGMHSYSHKYDEIYASKEAFINDLSKIQSLVYEQTGYMPDIYRFPGGSSNLVSKISMSVFINVLNE
ncbi:MAG TPA: polysaccharide deacetylase family protein, partial [Lachnospiraceae bacterium]|nr:polysaccharide deacetylase family protein [Lachnospiraceae bacterium]